MALTAPSTAVAAFDKGRLAAGISASDTTITVGPIYKTVNGVRTKQGFDSTSGECIISQGDYQERISFEGSSVNATTKVTSLTTCTRGLPVTNTTANFTGGTGRAWPKGAYITVVDAASYNQSSVFKNVANTFTAVQTFGTGGAVRFSGTDTSGLRVKSLTTAQRDALTPANGDFIYNSDTGVMNQYIGGAWAAIGTDATANGSTTVAGKFEEATVAEQGTATATGGTGARLVPAVANLVKTSSGAGDENKIPILDSTGKLASGFIPTSTLLIGIFGDGSDGDVTISSPTSLARDMYYNNLTVNSTLDPAGYRIFVKGTLSGTGTIVGDGNAGTAGGNASGNTGGTAGNGGAALAAGYLPASIAGTNGSAGSNGSTQASGGSADPSNVTANAVAQSILSSGTAGGVGGNGGQRGGGSTQTNTSTSTAGVATALTAAVGGYKQLLNLIHWRVFGDATSPVSFKGNAGSAGGTGGRGGQADSQGTGAGGGGGGGGAGGNGRDILVVAKTVSGTFNVTSIGGAGGNGGNGGNGSSSNGGGGGTGGGGAGGNGGIIVLIYNDKSGWSGALTVTAGSAGSAGSTVGTANGTGSSGGLGAAGTAGVAGLAYQYAI